MGAVVWAEGVCERFGEVARKLFDQVATTSRISQGTPLLVLPRTPTPAVDLGFSKASTAPISTAKRSRAVCRHLVQQRG